MNQNQLAIRTSEIILYGTFEGMPIEQCEYKEVMDFFNELWNYMKELAARAMEAIVEMLTQAMKNLEMIQ